MAEVYVSQQFRFIDCWQDLAEDFYYYKLENYCPDYYGRDVSFDNPYIQFLHHIHVASDQETIDRWKLIRFQYNRTNSTGKPEKDRWLVYAHDPTFDHYLLIMIVEPDAHNRQKWGPIFNMYKSNIVNPWINGCLSDVVHFDPE